MNHFGYRPAEGGEAAMACEEVALAEIAAAVGTPVYVYSTATLRRHFRVYEAAFKARRPLIAYAVKANPNLAVIATLARLGAGADTVSEGEIRRALAAGVPPERILFSGVGKTRSELTFALTSGVAEINVESEPELDLLTEVATELGRRPEVAIRVNPDIGAGGHAKITTGGGDSKFGVSIAEAEALYLKAAATPALNAVGLACHIGSQITTLEPLERAARAMRALVERLRAGGATVRRLDLGGGLGVPYFNQADPPSPEAYAAMIEGVLEGLEIDLVLEPGRVIVANAGVLVSRVVRVHARPDGRRFLILDAAMNDLIRPAMYDAFHDIRPVIAPAPDAPLQDFDVVGPICETGDTFARARALPPLTEGDLVAFMTAGAYGAAMSGDYNSRLLAPEVLVDDDRFAVVRPRPGYEAMLARETPPPWL